MNLFQELITEQLDSVEGPPLPEELQQAKRARLESRWHEAARAMDLQQARPAAPVGTEGAHRAGSGGAALTPPVQTPIIASTSPPLNKLTSDETKSIMASTKGFEASVRKLLKCNAKVDKGKADLQLFAQDTTCTRYPAGIRSFKSAAEMVELDSTLSQCKERDWVFMVTIPVGTTRRSALQKLHREHATFVRSTDVEALEEQQSTLRGLASLAHFREKCTTALREARAERDSNTARLDFPVRTETADCVLSRITETCLIESTRNCALRKSGQTTRQRMNPKRWKR